MLEEAMLTLLALTLIIPASRLETPAVLPDPAIKLRLSDDFDFRGERAKVRFKAERGGYLLVVRLDAEGRIRPLFPVDPDDSSLVRGGREFEVRSRGDRDAFTVDERDGTGYVLAAISDVPFDLSRFTRGSHWDLRALAEATSGDDPELALLDLVDSLATGRFDYDLASYAVGADRRDGYHRRPWIGGPGYYDPWFRHSPFWGPRFGISWGIGVGGHRRHRWFW
jgi:hypothetical protein